MPSLTMERRPNPSAWKKEAEHESLGKVDHTHGGRGSRGRWLRGAIGCRRVLGGITTTPAPATTPAATTSKPATTTATPATAATTATATTGNWTVLVSSFAIKPEATKQLAQLPKARIQALPCGPCGHAIRRPRTASPPHNRHQAGCQAQGRRSQCDRVEVTQAPARFPHEENRTCATQSQS